MQDYDVHKLPEQQCIDGKNLEEKEERFNTTFVKEER